MVFNEHAMDHFVSQSCWWFSFIQIQNCHRGESTYLDLHLTHQSANTRKLTKLWPSTQTHQVQSNNKPPENNKSICYSKIKSVCTFKLFLWKLKILLSKAKWNHFHTYVTIFFKCTATAIFFITGLHSNTYYLEFIMIFKN